MLLFLTNSKKATSPKKIFIFSILLLLILLFEWFLNHPALRYGGFTLIALSIYIPLSLYMVGKLNFNLKLKKKITFLICLSFAFFLLRMSTEYLKNIRNITTTLL